MSPLALMFPLAVIFVKTKSPSKIALPDASDNVTLSEKLPESVFKLVTLVENDYQSLDSLLFYQLVTLVEKLPLSKSCKASTVFKSVTC